MLVALLSCTVAIAVLSLSHSLNVVRGHKIGFNVFGSEEKKLDQESKSKSCLRELGLPYELLFSARCWNNGVRHVLRRSTEALYTAGSWRGAKMS